VAFETLFHQLEKSITTEGEQYTIMERPKRNLVIMALLFFIGVMSLFHFSQDVRIVDVVGLSGGGAACGAAMFGIIFALRTRNKT
jgi:hypothetical protein